MQPIQYLRQQLEALATVEHYLFRPADLRALLPTLSDGAFKTLLSRCAKHGPLERLCRGLYLYTSRASKGLLLFHAAARLRAHEFNYLSLETVLSESGVISQIPMQWISLMSSGRSSMIRCGRFGTIEFIHTRHRPQAVANELQYDPRYRLWKASVPLALEEMRRTRRALDLIDWSVANEFIRSTRR
jgi:hypothetical protein